MHHKIGNKLLVIGSLIYLSGLIQAAEYSSQFVLDGIRANDTATTSIEATFSIVLPDKQNEIYSPEQKWGKAGNKEYIDSTLNNVDGAGAPDPLVEKFHFDGKVMRARGDKGGVKGGVIRYPSGDEFLIRTNPWHFLGGGLTRERKALSEVLASAEDVELHEVNGNIAVITAKYFQSDTDNENNLSPTAVKLWIDTSKSFRPIRIETYRSLDGGVSLLHMQYDNIELKEINGVFVPVSGDYTVYGIDSEVPEEGYSIDALRKMPKEEAAKHITIVIKPIGIGKQRMIVSSISVNTPIPDEKFQLNYEAGTPIWNDILQTGYRTEFSVTENLISIQSAYYLTIIIVAVGTILIILFFKIRSKLPKEGPIEKK